MKWLIVTPQTDSPAVDAVQCFLHENMVKSVLYAVENQKNKVSLDKADVTFKKIKKSFSETTHCIFLDAGKYLSDSLLPYLCGFLSGRNIPVFVTGYASAKELPAVFSGFKTFATEEKLVRELAKRFVDYLEEETKANAKKVLYEKGLPFTPDCFSFQIAKGNQDTCKLFLQAGMDVNDVDSAGTPMLCNAARAEHKEIVQLLLDNGANVNAISKDRGYSPLMDAIWRENVEIAEIFIKAGADLNLISNDGQSPLILAVGNGNEKICELLAKNGADGKMKDHMGMTAYGYAKLFKKNKIQAILEKYGKAD
ncbi:MAG: ankyrin repeat domain-containing protein [Spirochaetaceae bacterium]|nr:ankyrin repeat domain-containing protein [Spirochaetaceae bacterium]